MFLVIALHCRCLSSRLIIRINWTHEASSLERGLTEAPQYLSLSPCNHPKRLENQQSPKLENSVDSVCKRSTPSCPAIVLLNKAFKGQSRFCVRGRDPDNQAVHTREKHAQRPIKIGKLAKMFPNGDSCGFFLTMIQQKSSGTTEKIKNLVCQRCAPAE